MKATESGLAAAITRLVDQHIETLRAEIERSTHEAIAERVAEALRGGSSLSRLAARNGSDPAAQRRVAPKPKRTRGPGKKKGPWGAPPHARARIIALLESGQLLSAREMGNKLGVPAVRLQYTLKTMRTEGVIVMEGERAGARYRLAPETVVQRREEEVN